MLEIKRVDMLFHGSRRPNGEREIGDAEGGFVGGGTQIGEARIEVLSG